MAIVKNNIGVLRLDSDFLPENRDSFLSDEDELHTRSSMSESESDDDDDNDDGDDEVDSGAGSDDFDLSELREVGEEFCQLGNQTCSIPYKLYDLLDLGRVLSVDSWNDCLTEDERFRLAEYLPNMDQETFMRTLKDLFSGSNFHFGSPLTELFSQLKGGLFEPRVALYRQGLNFFQKRKHYHLLRKYQNSMVSSLVKIKDAWGNCAGYSIEERLRHLNILRSQSGLMYERDEGLGSETDSSAKEESSEGFWTKRLKESRPGAKMSHRAVYTVRSPLDVSSQGRPMTLEPTKYGKPNPKGILKVAPPKVASKKGHTAAVGRFTGSLNHGFETKTRSSASLLARQVRSQIRDDDYDDDEDNDFDDSKEVYGMSFQNNRNAARGSAVAGVRLLKAGKKQDFLKKHGMDVHSPLGEEDTESYIGLPYSMKNGSLYSHGRNMNIKQTGNLEMLTGKLINDRRDAGKKDKYSEKLQRSMFEDQMNTTRERGQHLSLKGTRLDWSGGNQPIRHNKTQEEASRSKKWKTTVEFQTGKNNVGPDSKVSSYKTFSSQMNDPYFHFDDRPNTSQEKFKRKFAQNGRMNTEELRGMYAQSEETESDSSGQVDEDDDTNPSVRKLGYPSGSFEGRWSASVKSVDDSKNVGKLARKNKKEHVQVLDGLTRSSVMGGDLGEQLNIPDKEIYSSKGKHRGKINESRYLREYGADRLEDKNFSGSAKLVDVRKPTYKLVKSGQMQGDPGERSHLLFFKTYSPERKRKGKVDLDYSMPQSNYLHEYISGNLDEDDLVTHSFGDHQARTSISGKKVVEAHVNDAEHNGRSNIHLLGCNSIARKRKGKVDASYLDGPEESDNLQSSFDDPTFIYKRGKKKLEGETSLLAMVTSDAIIPERGVVDAVPETKPPKKPFTLITPSVHTGFSFSIVHLLSAVRMAMITVHSDNPLEVGNHLERSDGRPKPKKEFSSHDNLDVNSSEQTGQKNFPSLTVQEIVNRVRSNPGDPCILETQEPLQDLVRGVLKILSSKTAPLGAKGWKALVFYEKSTKSWSWIGPVSSASSDHDMAEEETSSVTWGVPHKMLVKLVDAFANWLKSGQETLQQIGSLPAPPMMLMLPNMDEKERFKDLRAQKSLNTISPSSDEVRAYFRREELLRYTIPDRAFSYTAADGKKSIVAPLRRCGGKPTSKARDHFMLKIDRPPHVTILCLVRDAAARLPGSIGTRADVCTLIRDSQYIVEDVSDAQVNQVVSGALDRLHYERDPCVQFDGDRKLWVYLHRDREEEDFEDDGTSSTKKWKRQRKEATEHSDLRTVNDVSYHGTTDQVVGSGSGAGYDFSSDINAESSSIYAGEKTELAYNDLRPNMEENIGPFIDSTQGSMHQGHPMGWEVLDLNNSRENKMVCQENSTNEDFDDETFSRERPIGLLSATLV
ncbi:uncharacterized protein LOC143873748 [Tasmannia lanceolata]|uniref:uncharacterized protein LOC143873748 n=1 Tax=Tasmannia lanceolata TaxID=3420 RepID=UPI0040629B1F